MSGSADAEWIKSVKGAESTHVEKNKTSTRPNRRESGPDGADFPGEGGRWGAFRRGGHCEPVFDRGDRGASQRRHLTSRYLACSIEIGGPSGLVLSL